MYKMESIEKIFQDPALLEKLKETSEGRIIATKIVSFVQELETLPDSVKLKFSNEYGSRFEDTLKRLVSVNAGTTNEHSEVSGTDVAMIFLIIFAFAGIYS
jgi:hypothetical protein